MPFYRIKKLGAGLDGLIAEGRLKTFSEPHYCDAPPGMSSPAVDYDFVEVMHLHNPDAIVGDRIVSTPLAAGLLLHPDVLEECDDPRLRQFDTHNPWGKCELEGELRKGDIIVAYAQFERAFQATVYENLGDGSAKTLYTGYFKSRETKGLVERAMAEDRQDDLVFELKQAKLKELESDGKV